MSAPVPEVEPGGNTNRSASLHIDIATEAGNWPDPASVEQMISRATSAAIAVAGLNYPPGAELSVLLTDDAGMRELNREWRSIDKPTNVLSFPGGDVEPGESAGQMLGDIILACETVQCEAIEQSKSFEDHFVHLVVHGFLHLFGYDHVNDTDATIMENREREALAELGIKDPYSEQQQTT